MQVSLLVNFPLTITYKIGEYAPHRVLIDKFLIGSERTSLYLYVIRTFLQLGSKDGSLSLLQFLPFASHIFFGASPIFSAFLNSYRTVYVTWVWTKCCITIALVTYVMLRKIRGLKGVA
jgi:hypothetical protein